MAGLAVGKGHAVERDATSGQPASEGVQQPEQPFKSEDSAGVIRVVGKAPAFADHQFGAVLLAKDGHREVGQHDAQKAASAEQCLGQRLGTDATPAKKLETAEAHRLAKEAEAFVVQSAIDLVVERSVAVDRDSGGGVCNVDAGRGKQRCGVDSLARQPGQQAVHKTHCNSGLRSCGRATDGARRHFRPFSTVDRDRL